MTSISGAKVRREEEKARKKEEAQQEQIAHMKRGIEEANRAALQLKRSKRNRPAEESRPSPRLDPQLPPTTVEAFVPTSVEVCIVFYRIIKFDHSLRFSEVQ